MMRQLLGLLLVGVVVGGCQSSPEPNHVSLSSELKKQDDALVGQRFRTLLDFESDSDLVFARGDSATQRVSGSAHTGDGALQAAQGVTFKIDSLLYGMTLPGEWTLLGSYVRPLEGGPVTAELRVGGTAIATYTRQVPAGTWAFVGIDLADAQTAQVIAGAKGGAIALHLSAASAEYDDVLLVNNTRTLVPYTGPGDWQIEQKGGALRATAKASSITIPLAGAALDGWSVDEISARRLCLHRGDAFLTLLPDGRSIKNGVTQPQPEIATLTIPEECGRIDQDTPGDANNDGYNERLGSYEVKAASSRLTMKLTPAATPMPSPLIDIAGLPAGKLTVMVEGKLISTVARLPDSRVLVLLPLNVDQVTEIVVRASDNR